MKDQQEASKFKLDYVFGIALHSITNNHGLFAGDITDIRSSELNYKESLFKRFYNVEKQLYDEYNSRRIFQYNCNVPLQPECPVSWFLWMTNTSDIVVNAIKSYNRGNVESLIESIGHYELNSIRCEVSKYILNHFNSEQCVNNDGISVISKDFSVKENLETALNIMTTIILKAVYNMCIKSYTSELKDFQTHEERLISNFEEYLKRPIPKSEI